MHIENHVSLIGNLGDDPKTSYTQGGMAITRVSLATTSKRKNREGETVEKTQWHRVVFFGKLAEVAGEYLKKGSKVAVSGTILYDKYDKDGVTHYTTDIACDQMKMLDGRPADGAARTTAQRHEPAKQQAPAEDFRDDDIPF